MSLTIHLPPDQEALLKARAGAAGLEAESYVQLLLERELAEANVEPVPHRQREDAAEWVRRLDEWIDSQPPDRPAWNPLSFSRAELYD